MRRSRLASLGVGALLLLAAGPALANPLWPGYFELLDRPYSLAIPPDGSRWQSVSGLAPADSYLVVVEQTAYTDYGDAVVSMGDEILGTGVFLWPRVIVVTVSHFYRLDENGWLLMPQTESPGGPAGQTWMVLRPPDHWGETVVVESWNPSNGGGEPMAGDMVLLSGTWHVLRDVHLGIQGDFGVPVKPSTWGKLKRTLSRVF